MAGVDVPDAGVLEGAAGLGETGVAELLELLLPQPAISAPLIAKHVINRQSWVSSTSPPVDLRTGSKPTLSAHSAPVSIELGSIRSRRGPVAQRMRIRSRLRVAP